MSSSRRASSRQQSTQVAFCGMAASLSIVIMLMGGIIPIATYCVPMLCGLLLLPILLEYGQKSAWLTYISVALIALVMGFDKEASFFYIFIGYYPILKWKIDRVKVKRRRFLLKFLLFTGTITLMYSLLFLLMPMDAIVQEFNDMGLALTIVFVIVYDLCMFLYDFMLTPLVFIYANKFRPKLRFLRK